MCASVTTGMDSRFHQSDFGAAASFRKGSAVEFGGLLGKHPVACVQHTGCAFMTKPTLASRRVRGSSLVGEEADFGEIVLAPGSFFI